MGTDLHEQAADFVAERLREFAADGRVLRAERTALVQYVAVASARSAVPARTEYAMRKADQPLAEQAGMAVELQRNGGLESPPSGPERMRTATDSPKALAAVTGDPAERANALKALEQRAAVCGQCVSVARVRRSVVRAAGSVHAEILFVGDVPSADEDAVGEPFRGPAGEMMDKMLMAMGLKRDEVFLAPALRCRPDAPVDLPRKPTDAERAAAVSVKRQVWEDLLKVLELLGHPISDKQRGYFLRKR
jgi:hypothetical protein